MACVTLLGLTAAAASAETITKATFTLPTQAYWNDVLLQPGDYTLSLERNLSGIELVSIRGEGVAARFVVPAGSADGSGHSYLMVDEVNGTNVIRELRSVQDGPEPDAPRRCRSARQHSGFRFVKNGGIACPASANGEFGWRRRFR
jgi:hypothetical protein